MFIAKKYMSLMKEINNRASRKVNKLEKFSQSNLGKIDVKKNYKFLLLTDHGYVSAVLDCLLSMRNLYRSFFGLEPLSEH